MRRMRLCVRVFDTRTGYKSSPRFREGTAYVRLRHQPPQFKYPLVALHVVANIQVNRASAINVNVEVRHRRGCRCGNDSRNTVV